MADWAAVLEAIGQALAGDQESGRRLLLACWEDTTEADAAQRCVLAHYLADTEQTLADEVAWDEAALVAFRRVGEGDLAAVGIASAAALEPSLRLNLGDGYLRQGRTEAAAEQASTGLATAALLPDDGYGALIRSGLDRLAERVSQADSRAALP